MQQVQTKKFVTNFAVAYFNNLKRNKF